MTKRSFIWKIPINDFSQAVAVNSSWSDIAKRYCTHQGNTHIFQKRAKEEGLDTSHFVGRSWSKGQICPKNSHPKYKMQELLRCNKHIANNTHFKSRLLKEKLVENRCYTCGLRPTWNGQPLNLNLVHINGDKLDNRLDNLTLLCPNCHSQSKKMYVNLVFTRNCIKCDKEMPDNDEEKCKQCRRKQLSTENLEREIAILGLDGVARKHATDEKTIKTWLKSP